MQIRVLTCSSFKTKQDGDSRPEPAWSWVDQFPVLRVGWLASSRPLGWDLNPRASWKDEAVIRDSVLVAVTILPLWCALP